MNHIDNSATQQSVSASAVKIGDSGETPSVDTSHSSKLDGLRVFLLKSWSSLSTSAEQQYQRLTSSREARALKRVGTPNTASKLALMLLFGGMYILMFIKLIDQTALMTSYLEWNLIVACSALLITKLRWLALHGAVLSVLTIMHATDSSMLLSLSVYLVSFVVIWCKPYLKLLRPQTETV